MIKNILFCIELYLSELTLSMKFPGHISVSFIVRKKLGSVHLKIK